MFILLMNVFFIKFRMVNSGYYLKKFFDAKIVFVKVLNCKKCGNKTTKTHGRYNEAIKNGWNFFCSIKCRYAYQEKGKEFFCAFCSQSVKKTPAQIRQTKANVFCSKSCAARYNNSHKSKGSRRSKLEYYIEQQLKLYFPSQYFLCNTKKPIGLELDFYFPNLKLAIEINGFLHYQPIYGFKKLKRIQELDSEKALRCIKESILLCIIDVSNEPHLTSNIKEKHWNTVKKLVTKSEESL